MHRLSLAQILALEDHDGLLDVEPKAPPVGSDQSRVLADFEEINCFFDLHGRAPGEGPPEIKASMKERMLAMKLGSFRERPRVMDLLQSEDRNSLLGTSAPIDGPVTLDDILDADDELLNPAREDIFEFRHARPRIARPDRVSERKPAADFAEFKPLFDACVADLVAGRRKALKFANEQEINAGDFFILNGVMVFVAEVNDPHFRNGKRNARLRLIFENGTEGENLLRSLATELYKDPSGRRVSSGDTGPLFASEKEGGLAEVAVNGTIYVARSLSPHPEIAALDGRLHKIGFTTGDVESRLRGAAEDPTFLFAPVHLLRTYDVIGVKPSKLENLLHRFFSDARLNAEIPDRFGRLYNPSEWFVVPPQLIDEAVAMMFDGRIVHHLFDVDSQRIVLR